VAVRSTATCDPTTIPSPEEMARRFEALFLTGCQDDVPAGWVLILSGKASVKSRIVLFVR
jgi:hypothetical protein